MNSIKNGEEVLVKATVINYFSGLPLIIVGENLPISIGEDCIASRSLKTYEDGLNEAWELAGKLFNMQNLELDKIFGKNAWDIYEIMKQSPQEIAEKFKAWEGSKTFHVGDVVEEIKIKNGFAIVTRVNKSNKLSVIWDDGSCGQYDKYDFVKTGRTIDIESLLKQIGGTI